MSNTDEPVTGDSAAKSDKSVRDRLALRSGLIVQELGWDEDVDEELRTEIEDAIEGELIEEATEAVDLVLMWWRESDGDLSDALMDALTDLDSDGHLWLLTPKVGRDGYVDAADMAEAATTAGLTQTTKAVVSPDWAAQKLVHTRGNRK